MHYLHIVCVTWSLLVFAVDLIYFSHKLNAQDHIYALMHFTLCTMFIVVSKMKYVRLLCQQLLSRFFSLNAYQNLVELCHACCCATPGENKFCVNMSIFIIKFECYQTVNCKQWCRFDAHSSNRSSSLAIVTEVTFNGQYSSTFMHFKVNQSSLSTTNRKSQKGSNTFCPICAHTIRINLFFLFLLFCQYIESFFIDSIGQAFQMIYLLIVRTFLCTVYR